MSQPGTYYSTAEAAALVQSSPHQIATLAREGRIPFVEQYGKRWILKQGGMDFLLKYFSPEQRARSKSFPASREYGPELRATMLREAAKLDPECLTRQEEFKPQYWREKEKRAG